MTAKLSPEIKRKNATARSLAWVKKNPDKANASRYAWREKNREHYLKMKRKWTLKGKYGITPGQFEELALAQGYACAICHNVPKSTLHIDHCHETGRIRGLLCTNCNTALGLLKDNADFLASAITYLTK